MASSSSGKMGVVTFFPHNTFNSLRDPYSQLRAESRVKLPQKKIISCSCNRHQLFRTEELRSPPSLTANPKDQNIYITPSHLLLQEVPGFPSRNQLFRAG